MSKLTKEDFIRKARSVHGDRYDYSKVEYVNNSTKVEIVCFQHGSFYQRPNNHLHGNGCNKCAKELSSKRQATDPNVWVKKAKEIHGAKYDYSEVVYINNHTPITITCPIHGKFKQTPANHLKGQGCPQCGKNKLSLTQDEARKRISKKLQTLHYELVEPFTYKGDRNTTLTIHCKLHGYTWTTSWHQVVYAGTHLTGGCPICRQTYTKEDCAKAAKKCESRSEFAKRFKGEYFKCLREDWLDEVCAHMPALGNRYRRCIYSYEFPDVDGDKYVYVGLTDHLPYRNRIHGKKGSVFSFCKEHNVKRPSPIQLTEYIDKEEAKKQEGIHLARYVSEGWIPINRVKTGGLGGHQVGYGFTFEECKKRGQRFTKRSEWKREDYPTYYIASKRGWINDILKQKERFGNATQSYWTSERIHESALKYHSRSEFMRNEPVAYQRAHRMGILDEVCSHMERLIKPTGYSVDLISKEIDKYDTLTDFIANNQRMYDWLLKRKIKLTEISDKPYRKPQGNPKPVLQFTLDGQFVRRYNNAREAEDYGFSHKNISSVCHGQKKSHKGFVFKFEEKQE